MFLNRQSRAISLLNFHGFESNKSLITKSCVPLRRMLRTVSLRRLSRHLSTGPYPTVSRFLPITCTRCMASKLPVLDYPVSSTLPADSYQLLSNSEKAGAAEDALFEQEVRDVKDWWATTRYTGIKRPYSAEDVVSKRGALQQIYPSSLMARKLFNLFKERAAQGEPIHTSMSYLTSKGYDRSLILLSGSH